MTLSRPAALLVLASVVPACSERGPRVDERVALRAEPAAPPATTAPLPAPIPLTPGAIPARPQGPRQRCARLADDSGWTCSPTAATPEELARLVAAAESKKEGDDILLDIEVFDVSRPIATTTPAVAFLQLGDGGEFGSLLAFVALLGPNGWGLAADAGEQMYGVNGSGDAELVGARRDAESGLLVVETLWTNDDAACTEELSWHGTEERATVCDPVAQRCRTIPVTRTTIESRGWEDGRVTSRRTADGFRARLELRPDGSVRLKRRMGYLPRPLRPLGRRAVPLSDVGPGVAPFRI